MNHTAHDVPAHLQHDKNTPFWMVYCPSHGMPTVRHYDYPTAKEEAERIARKNGKPVYLLASTELLEVAPAPVTSTSLLGA